MPPPPLPSYQPPRLSFDQQMKRDAENMELLAIFHFVYGGIGLLATLAMALMMFLLTGILAGMMQMVAKESDASQGVAFLSVPMTAMMFAVALALAAYSMSSVACGVYLKQRRHRMFILVMSGLHCLSMPFGTALGICTLVVLQRDAARALFSD